MTSKELVEKLLAMDVSDLEVMYPVYESYCTELGSFGQLRVGWATKSTEDYGKERWTSKDMGEGKSRSVIIIGDEG